jgi:hypothetical protein
VVSANALQVYPEIQGVTRGTVWDNSNFEKFYLTTTGKFQESSTEVNSTDGAAFSEAKVTKSGSTWLINGKEWYWPSKSASSNFTAWAPVAPDGDPIFGPGSYEASTTIADQKDILVAFNSGSVSDFESGVPLKFRHISRRLLSRPTMLLRTRFRSK